MKKYIALAVIGGLWLSVELVAPRVAESRIEERAAQRTADVARVDADVRSFPMVTRLLLTGRVNRLDVTLEEVSRQRLTFASIRFEFHGVLMDRGALAQREARIEDIDRGRIVGELLEGDLAAALGAAFELLPGEVAVGMEDRRLTIGREGRPGLSVPIPDDLFPCDPSAELQDGAVVISCTIHEVPAQFADAARARL